MEYHLERNYTDHRQGNLWLTKTVRPFFKTALLGERWFDRWVFLASCLERPCLE